MFKHLSPAGVMVNYMLDSPLLGLLYNYGSLSCNVLLNGLCGDYIRHVFITITNFIFCQISWKHSVMAFIVNYHC